MILSFRKAILLYTLVPIVLIILTFMAENLISIKQDTQQYIEQHNIDLAISYADIFNGFLKPIIGAAYTNAQLLELYPHMSEDEIVELLELQVEQNPMIYGAAVAFLPFQYDKKRRLVAPYVHRKKGQLKRIDIAESGYDYTDKQWEWWNNPLASGRSGWTEPYFDEGAGNILMSTYSVPFYKEEKLRGVATVDIPLHEISNQINIPGIKGQEILVITSKGKIVLHPISEFIGQSINDVIEEQGRRVMKFLSAKHAKTLQEEQSKMFSAINGMMAGKTGIIKVPSLDSDDMYWYFYAPIASVQWGFAVRVKESEAFQRVEESFWYSLLFFCLLLALIVGAVVVVSGKFSRSLEWLISRCQRIERLNFHPPPGEQQFKIEEIKQLSGTLDSMACALDSHYSLQEDVGIAQSIRKQALPTEVKQIPGYQLSAHSSLGKGGCGEIYDFIKLDCDKPQHHQIPHHVSECVAFLLLDDANSGINAAVRNIQLRAIFRTALRQGVELEAMAELMNDYAYTDHICNGPVQTWLGLLDAGKAELNSLSLGNNAILHFCYASKTCQWIPQCPVPLALQVRLPDWSAQVLAVGEGDIIIIVSDGVTGAMNPQREQFAITKLERFVLEHHQQEADLLLVALQKELSIFSQQTTLQDEYTMMVIKRNLAAASH